MVRNGGSTESVERYGKIAVRYSVMATGRLRMLAVRQNRLKVRLALAVRHMNAVLCLPSIRSARTMIVDEYIAPRWHQGTIAPREIPKNTNSKTIK